MLKLTSSAHPAVVRNDSVIYARVTGGNCKHKETYMVALAHKCVHAVLGSTCLYQSSIACNKTQHLNNSPSHVTTEHAPTFDYITMISVTRPRCSRGTRRCCSGSCAGHYGLSNVHSRGKQILRTNVSNPATAVPSRDALEQERADDATIITMHMIQRSYVQLGFGAAGID